MSFHDYEEVRLDRLNRAEEIGRAFYEINRRLATNYGLTPDEPWEQLPDNSKALLLAAINELIDNRFIAPWSMVNRLEQEKQEVKLHWKTLNDLLS